MSKKDSIGKKVKRELVRAMLERTQSLDTTKMMSALGASAPAVYDDVEETLNLSLIHI